MLLPGKLDGTFPKTFGFISHIHLLRSALKVFANRGKNWVTGKSEDFFSDLTYFPALLIGSFSLARKDITSSFDKAAATAMLMS